MKFLKNASWMCVSIAIAAGYAIFLDGRESGMANVMTAVLVLQIGIYLLAVVGAASGVNDPKFIEQTKTISKPQLYICGILGTAQSAALAYNGYIFWGLVLFVCVIFVVSVLKALRDIDEETPNIFEVR